MVKLVSLLLALFIAFHPAVAAIPNPVLMDLIRIGGHQWSWLLLLPSGYFAE